MLESVKEIDERYHETLRVLEWAFTIIFTIEYITRLFVSKSAWRYASSFYGVVDLLATIPTYIGLFFTGGTYLVVIRAIRLLRVFRILKLSRQLREAQTLGKALVASRYKIIVFLGAVMAAVIIMGTLMYLIEGGNNGFTSIPRSIYWAIVTITTVGYGDIAPQTIVGQTFAAILMLMGYAIIAVPTGIVTAEIATAQMDEKYRTGLIERYFCPKCQTYDHEKGSKFCKHCGEQLNTTGGDKNQQKNQLSQDFS
jgi:voltage-gated potassium channel